MNTEKQYLIYKMMGLNIIKALEPSSSSVIQVP